MKRLKVLVQVVFGLGVILLGSQFFLGDFNGDASTAWGQTLSVAPSPDNQNIKVETPAATAKDSAKEETAATPAKEAPKEEIAATLKKDLVKAKSANSMDEGMKLFKQDRLEDALKQFQKASNDDPKSADAQYNIAATYHRLGKKTNSPAELKKAEDSYNLCLDRDDNHVACYRGLAVLLAEGGRVPEAFRLLEGWSNRLPKSCDAKIELARLHEEFGDKNSAKRHLLETLAIQKDNPRALTAMGHIYEELGNPSEALNLYQRSLVADIRQPQVAKQVAALKTSLTGEPAPVIVISKGTTNAAVEDQPAKESNSTIIPPPTSIKRSLQLVNNPYGGTSGSVSPYAVASDAPLNANIVPRYQAKGNEVPRSPFTTTTVTTAPYTAQPATNYPATATATPAVSPRYETAPPAGNNRYSTPAAPAVIAGPYNASFENNAYQAPAAPAVAPAPYTAPQTGSYGYQAPAAPARPQQGAYPTYQGYAPQPAPMPSRPDEKMHVVYRLKNVPATTLANALNSVFSAEATLDPPHGISIVPEITSNSLLIGGPRSKVEEAMQMAKEMDRPAAMVQVQVQIDEETESPKANTPEEAASEKEEADLKDATGNLFAGPNSQKRTMLFHTVLKSLENQAATVTVSHHEPQVVGMSRGPAGITTNNVNTTSLGTQITITPRLDGDKVVVLVLDISDSRLGPEEEGAVVGESKEGKPIRTPSTELFNTQSIVRLEDGKPLLLTGRKISGKIRLITVTANIIRPGETKPAKVEKEKK